MASEIGILLNIGICIAVYLGLERVQSMVFGESADVVEPEPCEAQTIYQRSMVVMRHGKRRTPAFPPSPFTRRTIQDVHRSDSYTRALQNNLARGIDTYFPETRDEIESVLRKEAVNYKTWTPADVNTLSIRIVVRVLAQKCCTETPPEMELATLEASLHEEMGCINNVLHLFPAILSPFAKGLLPTTWRMYANLSVAERLISIAIEGRMAPASQPVYFESRDSVPKARLAITANAEDDTAKDREDGMLSAGLEQNQSASTPENDFVRCVVRHPQTTESVRKDVVKVLRNAVAFKPSRPSSLRRLDSFQRETKRAAHLFFMSGSSF